jgi:predicted hydrolase (HD superfamily)
MITKVQVMRQSMNQERKEAALAKGIEADLVRQCEHLWVVSGVCRPKER